MLDPYKDINFVKRQAIIKSKDGEDIYNKEVIFPDYFSDTAVNIVASKYFHKSIEKEEVDIRDMFDRVSNTIGDWGYNLKYFDSINDRDKFIYKLKRFQINQLFSFNSPVYFNCGVSKKVQASACFILDIEDCMESITDVMNVEGKIFKKGSGSGMNLSPLRSKHEYINEQTGVASGPVSFLKVHDTLANVIKSGGSLRRSAKMAGLNMDHPDIEDFINCKKYEEEKLQVLKDAGIKPRPGCELSDEVFFQSTNLTIPTPDSFMEQVLNNGVWHTKYVTTGEIHKTYNARELLYKISQRTWDIGDPALQFSDTINSWNTVSNDDRIHISNPCLPLWAPVLTPDGYKKFESIKNKIYLDGEKDCSDLIKTSNKEKVYEIELKNGMCIYATSNHKISTVSGDIRVDELQETDLIKMCYQKIPYIQNNDEYEKGFIAGYLYSEGCLYYDNNKNTINATFCIGIEEFSIENDLLLLLKKYLTDFNKKFEPHYQKPKTCKVLVLNKPAVKDLLNIFKSKTKDDFDLFEHSISYQKGFIEAFITFDGHCTDYKYHKLIRVTQSGDRGLKILKQIQLSLSSFGVYCNLCISNHSKNVIRNDKIGYYQTVYNLEINDIWEFSKQFSLFSPKKQAVIDQIVKIPKKHPTRISNIKKLQAINSIREFSEEAVYDINVPNGNHFVTSGAIVHNCGEFLFLNNSSCNLAAINLVNFFEEIDGKYSLNFELFKDVIETVITAQDIIVDGATYPTEKIRANSEKYRPLGLGYTNLGSLLMLLGFPYDSDEGRQIASCITALMTGIAYQTSNKIAEKLGAFERFENNKWPFYNVLYKHWNKISDLYNINVTKPVNADLLRNANDIWKNICDLIDSNAPFRNAQVTLLAPTGTTSWLMDAQTTGVEPEYSHVKYKRLSNTDDGVIKITSDITKKCLENLGYCEKDVCEIETYITEDKALDLCRCLKKEHKAILDTSSNAHNDQTIHYSGHIKMLAAIQPFISGGISKTISMSNDCSVEDIFKCYVECWKLGLKGVAIYRDGSKSYQPLSVKKDETDNDEIDEIEDEIRSGIYPKDDKLIRYMHSILAKRSLPDERAAINHKFSVDRVKGYLNMGMFEDGSLGEVFITISKEGSTLSGLLDCLGTLTSISLQRGVPLKDIVEKMIWQKFEPAGWSSNPKIRTATSIVDYIFKYIGLHFLSKEDQLELGLIKEETDSDFEVAQIKMDTSIKRTLRNDFVDSGKICIRCGGRTIRKGPCDVCVNCGENGACG